MSEGVLSRHASMNSSSATSSAEELAQKYQRLFQEYSRIKAQHTVLKKAVVKEQGTNASLQGNVKEKEKELRKLQEQVDLLKYHNERLTKRIEAVQDKDNKGSSFSLLGGAVKKELEKSAQALEAATVDLQNKIQENEALHKEMSEVNHIYTAHVNGLHQQIADLEKQVEQLKEEVSNEQSETRQRLQSIRQDKTSLEAELRKVKEELATKSALLDENEAVLKDSDIRLQGEIDTLRAILFSKVGLLEETATEANRELSQSEIKNKLTVEAQRQLDAIVQQCKEYISGMENAQPANGLTDTLAHELGISITTFRDELKHLKQEISQAEDHISQLKKEKKAVKKKLEEETGRVTHLQGVVSDLHEKFRQRDELETIRRLEAEITELETQIKQQEEELNQSRAETEALKTEEQEVHNRVDEGIQVDIPSPKAVEEPVEEQNTPTSTNEGPSSEVNGEEEEEAFVYQGVDAPVDEQVKSILTATQATQTGDNERIQLGTDEGCQTIESGPPLQQDLPPRPPHIDEDYLSPEEVAAREAQLASMYEAKIKALNEKFQMADSKAIRYHRTVQSIKEKMEAEVGKRTVLEDEIARLQAEVLKVQDLLTTTESNYKSQLEVMTDFATELQQQLARRQ
ncbi:hypothetical protein BGW37DRAFT_40969, partial [Umbelopsis sp. PMI_123]